MKRVLSLLSLAALVSFTNVGFASGPFDKPGTRQVKELIVLYNPDAFDTPASAEQIFQAVNNSLKTPFEILLTRRLQSPRSARFLMPKRADLEERTTWNRSDPREMLQRYVVLSFEDVIAADLALDVLQKDQNVIWVEENALLPFSSTIPNDPKAQNVASESYQYALGFLNLYNAWDKTTGYGYVGVADNGIQWTVPHPDLGNVRSQFTANYGVGSSIDEGAGNTGSVGHGTHVAGLIAATPNNQQGTSGVCWNCSLMVVKANAVVDGVVGMTVDQASSAISILAESGAQVINVSAGDPNDRNCSIDPNQPMCFALLYAQNRDVLVVGASGNVRGNPPQFPASDPRVLSVGAININRAVWDEVTPLGAHVGSSRVAVPSDTDLWGVVAPGQHIFSTQYTGGHWNDDWKCADNQNDGVDDGWGWCSGTSMAAPQVSGLAAILRSVNPLLTQKEIRHHIVSNSSTATLTGSFGPAEVGMGLPDANAAVNAVSATNNRLTPLFAFYGVGTQNFFYTTAPQMASAAVAGTLPPSVTGGTSNAYDPRGTHVNGYASFPGLIAPTPNPTPKAKVWVFTTAANPVVPSVPLEPLYRMSYKCGDSTSYPTVCSTYPNHVDHAYVLSASVQAYKGYGYKLDGIEGYIYPNTISQPANTVALYSMYNPARDDHAIFPATEYSAMYGNGYTEVSAGGYMLGWVYPNIGGNRPTY